jgi:neutral ceramidase
VADHPIANDRDQGWLVGRGIADITGEPWDVGMMGYGMRFQRTTGIHLRQRSRAFVIADRTSGNRIAFVVADIGMFFGNVRAAVLARLDPAKYGEDNVVLTATHTHAGVAGYSGYKLYNTLSGFRPLTFAAIVDGVVSSIEQADADLAPGELKLSRGELYDASVNRSPQSFARNPDSDKKVFAHAVDPNTTVLRLERDGELVGVINWFATHGTSLTNRNTLISGDNKGYAAYHWERLVAGVDYLEQAPRFVAAFAQTNAGDMSPNVPDAEQGPTDNEFDNARIIGERQFEAAHALSSGTGTDVLGGIDTRLTHIEPATLTVGEAFTGDGRSHRLSPAVLGAAFAAGTKEGIGAKQFHQGVDANPALFACSRLIYRLRPRVGKAQSPKAMLIPVGALGWVADRLPIQLVRIGSLVLVAVAQEVTIVAGLRLRRAVAEALDVSINDVLVQGYANDYAGYLTTPEEYDAQRYEGGHTMWGRWQLPAYVQEVTRIASDMRNGQPSARGPAPSLNVSAPRRNSRGKTVSPPGPVQCTGVTQQPPSTCKPGDTVTAEFAVTDPRLTLLPTYAVVERRDGSAWARVADDGDWSTRISWRKASDITWVATVAWTIPADAHGPHRVTYLDATTSHPTNEFAVG